MTQAGIQTVVQVVLVGLGGGLGSVLRHGVGRAVAASGVFSQAPGLAGTLLVNGLGSLILGGLIGSLAASGMSAAELGANPKQQAWLLLVGVGFCGGLTTFSSLAMELAALMERGQWFWASVLGVVSLVVGVVLFVLGVGVVRWLGLGNPLG